MNIRTSFIVEHNPEVVDNELPDIISKALSMPLERFVSNSITKTEQTINQRQEWQGLNIRCFRTKKAKMGWCFKDLRHGHSSSVPDIILGFTGDVEDFGITLIHELLHLFRWDEKVLDDKAREIFRKERGK